jgi:hypothetical protein
MMQMRAPVEDPTAVVRIYRAVPPQHLEQVLRMAGRDQHRRQPPIPSLARLGARLLGRGSKFGRRHGVSFHPSPTTRGRGTQAVECLPGMPGRPPRGPRVSRVSRAARGRFHRPPSTRTARSTRAAKNRRSTSRSRLSVCTWASSGAWRVLVLAGRSSAWGGHHRGGQRSRRPGRMAPWRE